jgi:hypothetical protein
LVYYYLQSLVVFLNRFNQGGYVSSNRHHRRPRSQGGTRHYPKGNYVKVDEKKHYFWHCLFGNMTGEQIANELNRSWLDPDFVTSRRRHVPSR